MEPLKPQMVKELLSRPSVAPADVEEYERLLSERFTRDPNRPGIAAAPALPAKSRDPREVRLEELHKKLFPGSPKP